MKDMCQDYYKKSWFVTFSTVLFFRHTSMHPFEILMDHATGAILLYKIRL